jgi:hypothetical protein
MAETLDLEIQGHPGDIAAVVFERAVGNAVALLREFDSAISGRSRGMLHWYIANLHSNGSLLVRFQPRVNPNIKLRQRISGLESRVTGSFITGFDDLENKCETPPYLSEFGLQRAESLASAIGRAGGPSAFRFTSSAMAVEVTSKTSENISKLLPIRRKAIGSVDGNLEAINIHKRPRFLVYHAITKKAVTCEFDEGEDMERVKEYLGRRVTVFGTLHKNVNGDTIRVAMDRIALSDDVKKAHTGTEWGAPEFANTLSTAEYLRRTRSG